MERHIKWSAVQRKARAGEVDRDGGVGRGNENKFVNPNWLQRGSWSASYGYAFAVLIFKAMMRAILVTVRYMGN